MIHHKLRNQLQILELKYDKAISENNISIINSLIKEIKNIKFKIKEREEKYKK